MTNLSHPFRGTGGVYSTGLAPSTSTVTLLFSTSTKPACISKFAIWFCLSFKTFKRPGFNALINGACFSRTSKLPLMPGICTPYTSPLYSFFSGVSISKFIKPLPTSPPQAEGHPRTALKAVSELLFINLLIKEQDVEECDARDDDGSTEARYTIIQLTFIKNYQII